MGALGLVAQQPLFQLSDGGAEGGAELDQEIDVVEVLTAAEAVGEVVLGVDGGFHLAAVGAEEAEIALAPFGRRGLVAQRGHRDWHGQIVADSTQQVRGNHGVLEEKEQRTPHAFIYEVERGRVHVGWAKSMGLG